MDVRSTPNPDVHQLHIDGRREVFRVAHAMGFWRYSAWKLVFASMTEGSSGTTGIIIDTPNLETLSQSLNPASLAVSLYLKELSPQTEQQPALDAPAAVA